MNDQMTNRQKTVFTLVVIAGCSLFIGLLLMEKLP